MLISNIQDQFINIYDIRYASSELGVPPNSVQNLTKPAYFRPYFCSLNILLKIIKIDQNVQMIAHDDYICKRVHSFFCKSLYAWPKHNSLA